MVFEIQGVNFVNKGAELMLYAILEHLKKEYSSFTAVSTLRIGNFNQRNRVGLAHLAWLDSKKAPMLGNFLNWGALLCRMKLRRKFNIYLSTEVNAILDSSGFAYGDQWGPIHAEIMADKIKTRNNLKQKIILLPQAFGPFEIERLKSAMLVILENTDLVFARDHVSYEHLVNLAGKASNIRIAPDFTNLIHGQIPRYWNKIKNRACIIPNYRMIEKTDQATHSKYLSILTFYIRYLQSKKADPFILIHETDKDYDLAITVQNILAQPIEVIFEKNPLYIKGIIGLSSLVISSRYHGLVSALSQGIPCLGTGWSHKYQMLFEDYGCPECLVSTLETKDILTDRIMQITEEPRRSNIINRLRASSREHKELTQEMWDYVDKTVCNN